MTSISIKEYTAAYGSMFSHRDAKIIGPELQSLAEQGALSAEDVVETAQSENSPLHPYFEWDDKAAADQYRLQQARNMLRSIKVRYTDDTGRMSEMRAFQVSRRGAYESEPRKYRTFEILHGDSAFAAQMMDSAFDDLQTWKRKYEPYTQMWESFGDAFQQLLNQVSEWEDDFNNGGIAGDTDEALKRLLVWREECQGTLASWVNARDHMKFIMAAIGDAEETFAKLNEHKERLCIRCAVPFMSVSVGNRICQKCLNSRAVNERNPEAIEHQITR